MTMLYSFVRFEILSMVGNPYTRIGEVILRRSIARQIIQTIPTTSDTSILPTSLSIPKTDDCASVFSWATANSNFQPVELRQISFGKSIANRLRS